MAVLVTNQNNNLGRRITYDSAATNTVVYNIVGAPCTLYALYVVNTAGGNTSNYMRFWDAKSGVTNGTTDPDFLLRVIAGEHELYEFAGGITFSTGLTYTVVQSGGTAGTTAPGAAMTMYLITS